MRAPRFAALAVAATVIALAASGSIAQSPPPLPGSDTRLPLMVKWVPPLEGQSDWFFDLLPMFDKNRCEYLQLYQSPGWYLCLELATAPWVESIKDNLEQQVLAAVTQLPDDLAATEVVKTLEQRVMALEAEVAALRSELAAR
jgi:hypothetical protein